MPNAIYFYRISRWFYLKKIPFIPQLIKGLIFLLYNCNISYKCDIGSGSFFAHKGMGTLIVDNAIIGKDVLIGMNVLITGKSPYLRTPRIGNNIWIGPGSVISGPVIIEDNVIIGPNTFVNKSIYSGKTVGGVPCRILGNVKDLNYDIFRNENWNEEYAQFLTKE